MKANCWVVIVMLLLVSHTMVAQPTANNPTALTWVAVDTMQNAFSAASWNVKPLAYDNDLNALVLIHRGATSYVPSSSSLVYNRTFPNYVGTSHWRRILPDLNAGTSATCRYPSVAISNPNTSIDTSQARVVWSAPHLTNMGNWGSISYGFDPFGAGTSFAATFVGDNAFQPPTTIWTQTGSQFVYWSARSDSGFYLWRSHGFATIDGFIPPQWRKDSLGYVYTYICGKERNGVSFFGVASVFRGDSSGAYNIGYSQSNDNGTNWSSWIRPRPSWTSIPIVRTLPYRYWADNEVSETRNIVYHTFDMVVDANGLVHFFGVAADTGIWTNQKRAIVEIYEAPQGWDAKFIKTGLLTRKWWLSYPGTAGLIYELGNNIQAAASADGNIMGLVWLDMGATTSSDTLPDIWFSHRTLAGSWSTPENITRTPDQAELLLHAAPTLKRNSSTSYSMFLGRSYESGVSTYPPNNGNRTVFYVAQHTFTTTSVENNELHPNNFSLFQNYPNPFNPTTTISYQIPTASHVTLKVFDVLGREVATLVNEVQDSAYGSVGGFKSVELNASGLASGVYLYRLTASNFLATKKLVLLK